MKRLSWLSVVALLGASPAVARNPFLAPLPPCEALLRRLDGWQLQGVVTSAKGAIALMRSRENQWRRVAQGQLIEPGARMVSIALPQSRALLAAPCPAANYHWMIQGKAYGMAATVVVAGALSTGRSGPANADAGGG